MLVNFSYHYYHTYLFSEMGNELPRAGIILIDISPCPLSQTPSIFNKVPYHSQMLPF